MSEIVSKSDNFLATVQNAAKDTSVDIEKMERLYAMYKDIRSAEARQSYNIAMVECQKELPAVEQKNYNNQTHSYYAKQGEIIKEIKPIWTKHGFSISFYPGESPPDGFIKCMIAVSHVGGDTRTFSYLSPLDDKGIAGKVNKTKTHATASSFTYGSRYLLGLIFSLEYAASGDNDGNGEGKTISAQNEAYLDSLINEVGANKEAFLQYLKIENLSDLPMEKFRMAKMALEQKRKKNV